MTDVLGLTAFREELTALLRDELPDDIGVYDIIPDSISPPAIYIAWSNPWLQPQTFCEYVGASQLILVAARIEPGGQYQVLESLLTDTLSIMHAHRMSVRDVTAPYPIQLAGVNYLASSINIVHDFGS